MQSFKTGTYAGYTDYSIGNEYFIACTTSYDGLEPNEQMHSHENPHLSFVLSGGNLEKRKGAEIERLPGKIEIQRPFFKDYHFAESIIDFAANNNPSAAFLMLQVHKEIQAADVHSAISIKCYCMICLINQPS